MFMIIEFAPPEAMKKDKMEPALRADLRDLVAPLSVCLGAEAPKHLSKRTNVLWSCEAMC